LKPPSSKKHNQTWLLYLHWTRLCGLTRLLKTYKDTYREKQN